MTAPWLTVVGIGEDGLDGLGARARKAIDAADVLAGGRRHLDLAPNARAEKIAWGKDFNTSIAELAKHRGKRVVVLASGDPMNYGAGAGVARTFPAGEIEIVPAPGAFSLAAARMAWSLPDTETFTVHGRPVEVLNRHLAPGLRLLILSENAGTPARIAALLTAAGFGPSRIAVLERLGGAEERRVDGTAETWPHAPGADLNTVAVECVAGPQAKVWPRVPGLPEEAFEHDGQITKREVRAATLARLMPLPGQVLWDIGAGSGAVAIEWLRAEPSARAVAVERDAERLKRIERNARNLGVPELTIVAGAAPDILPTLAPKPDAVFIGGGVGAPGMLDVCWRALSPGGRLVANAVTLEGQAALTAFQAKHGGDLARLSVARAKTVGATRTAMKPLMDVLQLATTKERT